jgi:Na+/proline symporter
MYVDLIQFGIAMTGAIAVAYFSLAQPEVGGLAGLVGRLPHETLALVPDFGNWGLALSIFIIPLTVQWWSVWYPGAEPGGGSYVAQRMLAARSERDALGGTLLFNATHYALRSWPWILVALASLLVFPDLQSIRTAFPNVDPGLVGHDMAYPAMLKFLPHGFLGIMIAGMLAAYVSTLVTHLNWGASYLVHDFWRRFIRPGRDEAHYVMMGRLITVVLMAFAASLTFVLDSAQQAFQLLLSIGAGTGLLYLLRWFWWRINAWCEIVAMVVSFMVAIGIFVAQKQGVAIASTTALLTTVAVTSLAWVVTALVTPAEPREVLVAFYRKIRPAGPGWADIRREANLPPSPDSLPQQFLAWTLGCLAVYGTLFGTGSWLYGHTATALFWTVVAVISTVWLIRLVPRLWSAAPVTGDG